MTKRLQTTLTRAAFLTLLVALALGAPVGNAAHAQDDPQAEQAIQLVAQAEEFADFLAGYADWEGQAEQEDGDWWYVDFWSDAADEWLGDATVNIKTGEIRDSFVPRPLPADEYADLQPRVQTYALEDAAVQALLGDPTQWDIWTDYDRFDGQWYVDFMHGLDHYVAVVRVDTNDAGKQVLVVDDLFDANDMDAEQLDRANRDAAVALAYEAEGIGAALEGYDNWTSYVEPMEENIYSVEFVNDGQELFHAVVNLAERTILESTP